MSDFYSNLNVLPSSSLAAIAERLETRAENDEFVQMQERYFDALALADDAKLLELGGGTGVVGRAYVRRPGFAGVYVVSDLSEALLRIGSATAEAEGLLPLMDFCVIDAVTGEGMPDTRFDAVILHTVLSHVPDVDAVLDNACAALRPGGSLVAFDADYGSLQIVSGNAEQDAICGAALKEGAIAQPTVMRRLPVMCSRRGLILGEAHPHFLAEVGASSFFLGMAKALVGVITTQGGLDAGIGSAWLASLDSASARGEIFAMCPYFTYIFRKPEA